ncbi:SGNH/GDSL hydrolase family protein [Rhodococcus pyridinivorans]|uniref:SGNH/GDSL hydrolase family protein n=1 Tax=Rhodococcus pyridinivorans TaxID=103816 RepID=A0A7M2XHI6_9NOCA|nr:SGNH/GDSL hydrolase family protein [Rhodococcus pyridinivorans]QOV97157.1 SGNH/GDSL hydrolase family protein [Rhodococcus pyridinivorans]QOV97588.1 SGNH/GDSL hydrolase family protein [Rhodococcus pyridinivorans]QOV99507.1 SGNH/GDSL hydrolase family protein [Rhodococcus pyridinivorans]
MGTRHKSSKRVRRRNPRAIGFAVFMSLALIAVVGMAWAVTSRNSQTDGSYASTYTPAPPAPVEVVPRIAFVGDSFTAGTGAPAGLGYTEFAAKNFGMVDQVTGEPSSGYITPGKLQRTMGQLIQIATKQSPAPEVVVLASGYNDNLGSPPDREAIRPAIREAFAAARTNNWGDSTIVVVGPWTPTGAPSANQIAVNDVLREEAAASGFAFIDSIATGLVTPDMIGDDKIHPTPAGHRILGERIAAHLQGLVPAQP